MGNLLFFFTFAFKISFYLCSSEFEGGKNRKRTSYFHFQFSLARGSVNACYTSLFFLLKLCKGREMQINAGLFILLPVVLQQTSSARTDKIIYGLLNGHVQISPSLSGSFQEVIWHFGVNKVAEWDSLTNKPDYYPPFKGRTHLEKNATLSIENLTEKDSGGYSVDMHINEKVQTQQFTIEVIRPVSKPNITAKCNETQCSLSCEGDSTVREYSWSINGRVGSWSNTAERLLIWRNESLEYVCKVRNPKSEEESEPFVIEPLSDTKQYMGVPSSEASTDPAAKNGASDVDNESETEKITENSEGGKTIRDKPVPSEDPAAKGASDVDNELETEKITENSEGGKTIRDKPVPSEDETPDKKQNEEPESKRIPSTSDDETLKQPEDTQYTSEADPAAKGASDVDNELETVKITENSEGGKTIRDKPVPSEDETPDKKQNEEPESKRIPSTSDDETLKQPEDTQYTSEADPAAKNGASDVDNESETEKITENSEGGKTIRDKPVPSEDETPDKKQKEEPESKRIPSTSDDETLKQPEDTQTTTEADDVP
ncbi:protein IWS1 homolog isoform X2 [Lepisosteus oculatus]|uniref:protein IWS1 homolog isoform X2 n=1 Tax=Lepisosteus oculatus TaxID=7918 RepID=UPI0035F51362